jgi:hypothetical protein
MASGSHRRSSDLVSSTIIDVTVQPMESEALRSECQQIIDRMYSDSGNVGNVSPADVIRLLAIFRKNRTASLYHEPRLLVFAKTYAINKLLIRTPFHHFDEDILFHLRRYITLLAEVLRSFRDEEKVITIEHVLRSVWYYEGINRLSDNLERAGRERSDTLEIEWWDAKITLKHCQYLLLSMNDSFSGREHVMERSGMVIKGALQGYGAQYVDAKASLDGILSRQRKKEPWHEKYVELESMYFETFHYVEEETPHRAQKEKATVIELRDNLERELASKATRHSSTVKKGLRKVMRELGKQFQASGPYEENDYYFEYLILDLMYKASFALKNRLNCLSEIIGGVQSVLQWAHESASLLHLKATDLYLRIDKLAMEDKAEYIKGEQRRLIEQWMLDHSNNVEKKPNCQR